MKSAVGSKPAPPYHRPSENCCIFVVTADQKGKEKAFLKLKKAIIPFRITRYKCPREDLNLHVRKDTRP
jgi:hypothetical protein